VTPFRRPSGASPQREDVEGFLEGVSYRVAQQPADVRGELVPEIARAVAALRDSDLTTAETILLAADRRMDEVEGERELAEFPRGLVDYVPIGDRGRPTPNDDDPLANRIRLVGRLLDVRRSQGRDVDAATETIRSAEAALARGDRGAARSLCDRAHATAEADTPAPPDPEG